MVLGVALVVAALAAFVAVSLSRTSGGGYAKAPPEHPLATADVGARLDEFWSWWRTAAPRLAATVDAQQAASIAEEVGARVNAIDSRLAWEAGPGIKGARHHFALSSEGDVELRVLTERWLSRAPPPDAAWEYYPARQAFPRGGWDLDLGDAGGVKIDFGRARVATRTDAVRERMHVNLYHPVLTRLTESQRTRAAFLMLDTVLGEDGVERWVGGIKASTEELPDGKTLEDLAASVDALSKAATGEQFAILEGKSKSDQPTVATVNLALKRVDHLLMDYHASVTILLKEPTPQGLTTGEEAAALNLLEDALAGALGHDAVYIGRETGQGKRTLHFHVAGQGPAESRIKEWAQRHTERHFEVAVVSDPRWEVLRRW